MTGKRVAIIISGLYGGGMERVAAQLSIMLSEAGYVAYIMLGGYDKGKIYKHKGKIITVPFKYGDGQQSVGRELVLLLYNSYLLRRCKKANKIDIAISFAPEMNMLNMLSGTNDRKILTIHSCLSARKDVRGLCYQNRIYKIYNHAYKVIAVSKWCKKDLIQHYGINKNKVKVIYNPVEESDGQYALLSKENVVLVVGRMQDVKQQWHIIRAFKIVLEKVPDAKLVIAGQGENRKYFLRLCADMEIDNSVIFKGFVNDIDMLYRQAKCIVFSSASEAFPCSVIEAMANGVPVVAADCPGGIREIIAGNIHCTEVIKKAVRVKGGILTPRLDGNKYDGKAPITEAEYELAKGIVYLLENEGVRTKLASNCLKISQSYDERKIRRKWLKLLQNIF